MDSTELPLVVSESSFLIDGEIVSCLKPSHSPVSLKASFGNLHSSLYVLPFQSLFGLEASVQVELEIVMGEDSIIVVQFESIVLDPPVEGFILGKGEPEFDLSDHHVLALLLGKSFFEIDGGFVGLDCGFDCQYFIVDKVVFKD